MMLSSPQFGGYEQHDYDPNWDYEVQEQHMGHPLVVQAQQRLNRIASSPNAGFTRGHVVPVDLSGEGVIGRYASGTFAEPVVLVDVAQHEEVGPHAPQAMRDTVEHELRHARQEADNPEGDWADEEHAEHGESFWK